MEFATELHFSFDELIVIAECHLGQLHAEGELAAFADLVFVLDVRVHISEEQLLVIEVGEADPHTLIWCFALESQLVVCLKNIVKDCFVYDLNFHLQSLFISNMIHVRG